ncbi:Ig-like domain-containing protein [Cellulophaga baltica]|uniref:Ig-like domain-containing protein n=1 Tax=Cellulophaga TaxID=104264 RepID=UPI001C067131|nr:MULTISPECIES: Ig-like domain-containing protein [Cellulophaga]MBU2995676.1 Ig-like domain-containing protein [Cellulophaga baltica]MDO6767070.1 Ig-like domain-containing protein [Cellulophaga sp. 1_MG-2023]
MIRRILACVFLVLAAFSLYQCAVTGTPSGGIKDIIPPKLTKAEPKNMSLNFKGKKFRLYFDEYVKLNDVTNQLIVSPPLKYTPTITPSSTAQKYVEVFIKDTLKPNTTYTFNFGQSIVDNNEGNPNSFFTYIFSTGTYIDSLSLKGVVEDAYNKEVDSYLSIMLYEIDSTYNDSTVFKRPPNHITNTLDSTFLFELKNLKKGKYALFGVKDESKNNVFDQGSDKIAFLNDTITLPTDETYLLTLFKEEPNYAISVPKYESKNKIVFGYQGNYEDIKIKPLSIIPDSIRTKIAKQPDKDTLNFWFTPYDLDSLQFTVTNEKLKQKDTFTIKSRKVGVDSFELKPNFSGAIGFKDNFSIAVNTPITRIDDSKIKLINKDSLDVEYSTVLDTLSNSLGINFEKEPNEAYRLAIYPCLFEDFFGNTNDTIVFNLTTKSYADFGNLELELSGEVTYPVIVQLTDEKGVKKRELYATEPKSFYFSNLTPGNYLVRVISDDNNNRKWDTGNYLKNIQPERVSHSPKIIEMRANWEEKYNFSLLK